MKQMRIIHALVAAVLVAAGCTVTGREEGEGAGTGGQPDAVPAAEPAPPPPDLRIEVDLAARELRLFRNERLVEAHPVAVGTEEWPTPTGQWTIGQVVWNPRWIPPDQAWAEDAEVTEPGDPENPLGQAQLVYDAPNSIHGTNEPSSIGQAVSHGSIRVSNDVAVRLARLVMEAGGAARDEAWYREAEANRTDRRDVSIPNPIPIRVVAGSGP
jgi:lipoprotein-anchoring transpeptidase ErfK/SrfK